MVKEISHSLGVQWFASAKAKNRKGRAGERGSSIVELVMILPLIVLVILLLVGLGHTMITKHHTIVAARFAATYKSVNGTNPSPQLVSKAVSQNADSFQVSVNTGTDGGSLSGLGGGGFIDSAFNSVFSGFNGDSLITAATSTKPERGLIPRLTSVQDAQSRYYLVSGTWTCEEGGNLFSFLSERLGLGSLNLLTGKLSCCETYEGQK